jgi:anti-sigma regulatory factor (Ser/Thr protein kinase)/biotin operon repressor
MTRVRRRGELVRKFIVEQIDGHPKDIVRTTCERFGISRQAVNKHLKNLVEEKAVVAVGVTSGTVYRLAPLIEWREAYTLSSSLTESAIWRGVVPSLGNLPENVLRIWQHGFTEMFNNVIDHSGGNVVSVTLKKTAASTQMAIHDDGVGIFRKIQLALNLLDPRHSVLELAKGKFTTDPVNHSGEGIFFTSRVFDDFQILAGGVYFSHDFGDDEDWILDNGGAEGSLGTSVFMRLHNHTARTLKSVFDQFGDESGDFAFTKTVVPVKLAQYGDDNLVSRSQAKRLLARVDRFRTVMLDFMGVETIGQAFADEIFRVFRQQHPEVKLLEVNTNRQVNSMILRVRTDTPPPSLAGDGQLKLLK